MLSAGAPEHPRVTLYMGADKHESEMSVPCVLVRNTESGNIRMYVKMRFYC